VRHYRRFRRSRPKSRVDSTRPLRHAVYVSEGVVRSPTVDEAAARERLALAVISARERLNVTQEEFAERAGEGLSLKTLQRVELKRVRPTIKTFNGLDRGAGWKQGDARRLYEDGREPEVDEPGDGKAWVPMLTEEQIVAMDGGAVLRHYVKLELAFDAAVAEDWLFHAVVVRRNARIAERESLAVDGQ